MNTNAQMSPSPQPPRPSIMLPRSGPRSGALRVVRIEPPVIERTEPAGDGVPVQGVLPLEGLATPGPPNAHPPARRRRCTQEASDGDLQQLARQFCVGATEVLFGDRPVTQMLRCTTERVYSDLAKRSAMARSRRRMTAERVARARVERLRLQRPSGRSLEICARLRQGERSHALAVRMELINGRWICVALEAALP